MLIAIFSLLVCLNLAILGGVFYAKYRIRLAKQDIISLYNDFVMPQSDEEGSQLAQTIDSAAHIFTQRLLNTVSAHNMQSASVNSRMVNELEKDMASDLLAAKHPEISFVLEMLPSVKKRLMKNPAAIQYALPMIGKMAGSLAKPGSGGPSGNGHDGISSRIGQ